MRTINFIRRSGLFIVALFLVVACGHELPNLIRTWSGEAPAISSAEGIVSGEKKIIITEQDGTTFRGKVITRAGEKDILGSIASDNEHFVYVHIGGMGHAEGRILGSNRLETCYVNPGDNAVVGCSVSTRD